MDFRRPSEIAAAEEGRYWAKAPDGRLGTVRRVEFMRAGSWVYCRWTPRLGLEPAWMPFCPWADWPASEIAKEIRRNNGS